MFQFRDQGNEIIRNVNVGYIDWMGELLLMCADVKWGLVGVGVQYPAVAPPVRISSLIKVLSVFSVE